LYAINSVRNITITTQRNVTTAVEVINYLQQATMKTAHMDALWKFPSIDVLLRVGNVNSFRWSF